MTLSSVWLEGIQMTEKLVTIVVTTLILLTVAEPAMALAPVAVPEPATMSLFGLGVAGAFIARKFIGRK
jgi:hypothetical protein